MGTVLYSAYLSGFHQQSEATWKVKEKGVVIGIRPGTIVGAAGEVKFWKETEMEGQRKSCSCRWTI